MLPLLICTAAAIDVALCLAASVHVILYKRDPRAAVSWLGFIWLVPFGGVFLYVFFGINRIQRRAVSLRRRRRTLERACSDVACTPKDLEAILGLPRAHLLAVSRVGEAIAQKPLLEGNLVTPLINGEAAYPAMLKAIDEARHSVALEMYILEKDVVGDRFLDALARAAKRGVEVRVLLDDIGASASLPAVEEALAETGARVARFHPVWRPLKTQYLNLRNHRKLLIVDGGIGFTGGMNIRRTHLVADHPPQAERDLHFRVEGPVVGQMQDVFIEDWSFSTEETLSGDKWFPCLERRGPTPARGVAFDPGQRMETPRWLILAALAAARSSIRIVTPYFIPDSALVGALNVAALRGVEVDILIPERSDNRIVQWASMAMLWQVLEGGCRVWLSPAPFDHTKLLLVDGLWVFLGSANLDPRSLRLNFEFNVECYDATLAGELEKHVAEKRSAARPITLKQADGRALPVRLRDGVARLFAPYL